MTTQDSSREPRKEPKPMFVTTTGPAISGYFAVIMWWNDTGEHDLPGFWEPWNTGVGRYATNAEAIKEAKMIARSEGLEYREDEPT